MKESSLMLVRVPQVFLLVVGFALGENIAVMAQGSIHQRYGSDFMEYGNKAIHTSDGHFIVVGATNGFGSASNAFLMKLDAGGDQIWMRDFAGINGDEIWDVIETEDNEYMVCGGTNSFGAGQWDGFIMKTDNDGNILWAKTYGNEYADFFIKILEDGQGGYFISGLTQSVSPNQRGAMLMRLNSMGEVIWNQWVPNSWVPQGSGWYPIDIALSLDGDIYLTALNDGNGNLVNIWKFSMLGEHLWSKTHWLKSKGHKLAIDASHNLYITCLNLEGVALSMDFSILKLDSTGEVIWHKSYGGTYSEWARGLIISNTGHLIITGMTNSAGNGGQDAFLVKLDSDGSVQWAYTYGSEWVDIGTSVSQTNDNGYLIAGESYSYGTNLDSLKVYVIETDAMGNASCNSMPWNLTQLEVDVDLGDSWLEPEPLVLQTATLAWSSTLRSFRSDDLCSSTSISETEGHEGIEVYPNPFSDRVSVMVSDGLIHIDRLILRDMLGRIVYDERDFSRLGRFEIELGHLLSGMYTLTIVSEGKMCSSKIIKGHWGAL